MEKEKIQRNVLEYTVTIISSIIVCFAVGFLIFQIITEKRTPPDLVITIGDVVKKDSAFSVPIKATNRGYETAENVVLEFDLDHKEEPETVQITFAYIPGKSSVTGWVIFANFPRRNSIKSRVIGYGTP